MMPEELKIKKIEFGLTNELIAEASGVPLSTVQKIMSGATKAPRRSTLEAIEKVLAFEERRRAGLADKLPPDQIVSESTPERRNNRIYSPSRLESRKSGYSVSPVDCMVRETSPSYNASLKKTGFTLEEYYALPDDRRVELIDGVFYDLAAPSNLHQKILLDLAVQFRECIHAHDMPCEVFAAPFDVRLDRDDRTMVQPDLTVICGPLDLDAHGFDGAPDLTLEVLSPSTQAKDRFLKLYKYQHAGVREYWIVDPAHASVTVYDFENEDSREQVYSFEDTVPVHISGGKCSIDFPRISSAIRKALERNGAALP